MALEKRVFSTPEFQSWGKNNAVLFAATMTKIEGRKEDDLLRTYEFRGFPSMAILDAKGEAITKKIGRDLPSMETVVAASTVYSKLKSKVDAGERYDKTAWFFAQIGLGQLDAEEAIEIVAGLKLSGADAKKADQQVLELEMAKLRPTRRSRGNNSGNASEAIFKFFKAGRRLPKGSGQTAYFDSMLIEAAQKHGDAKAFEFSYQRVRTGIETNIKNWEDRLPRHEKDLKKYEDDASILPRVERAIRNAKMQIERGKKSLVELDASAKKLGSK